VVICLGAGSSTHWAAALPDQLAEIIGENTQDEQEASHV